MTSLFLIWQVLPDKSFQPLLDLQVPPAGGQRCLVFINICPVFAARVKILDPKEVFLSMQQNTRQRSGKQDNV